MPAKLCEIPVRLDGLQLDERPRLQSVTWFWQRLIWFLCLCLVVIALLGLTGRGGPWAERVVTDDDGRIRFPQITRRQASELLMVHFAKAGKEHRLTLTDDLLTGFEIPIITPRPRREDAIPGGIVLHFGADGPPPHAVTLTLRARQAGFVRTTMGVDGQNLPMSLLILP